MLTGRRTVFIPAALRVVTSSCVNQVALVENGIISSEAEEKAKKKKQQYQCCANFASAVSG